MTKTKPTEAQLKRRLTKFLKEHCACPDGIKFCKGKTAQQVWNAHRKARNAGYRGNRYKAYCQAATGIRWWCGRLTNHMGYHADGIFACLCIMPKLPPWRDVKHYFADKELA